MNTTEGNVHRATPRQLGQLIRMSDPGAGEWRPSELQSILLHQLAAELHADLSVPGEGPTLRSEYRTFAELLFAPHPPRALLERVKDFAKTHYQHPRSALPQDVGRVIYYASVVAARVHAKAKISSLSDADLLAASRWALQQSWLSPRCRAFFVEAETILGSRLDSIS